MNTENQTTDNKTSDNQNFSELARKIFLAGVGAAALAHEEAEAFIKRLIEKGEIAENDGVTILKNLRNKRRKRVEDALDKRISIILERLDIPTQSDYETLTKKITELTQKLDEI